MLDLLAIGPEGTSQGQYQADLDRFGSRCAASEGYCQRQGGEAFSQVHTFLSLRSFIMRQLDSKPERVNDFAADG
jgi:hypothetical protein